MMRNAAVGSRPFLWRSSSPPAVQVSTAPAGQAATAALSDGIALSRPERVGFSGESLKELDAAMQGIVDKQASRRRRDAAGAPRPGRAAQGLRRAGHRQPDADAARHHRPHLLDDQADRRRGDDDAVRGRQVEAERSDREAHPRVREPQGLLAAGRRTASRCSSRRTTRRRWAS